MDGSMHILETKLLQVVSDHVTLSKDETEHLSTCAICLETLRDAVRKDLLQTAPTNRTPRVKVG